MFLLISLVVVLYYALGAYLLDKNGIDVDSEFAATVALSLWPIVLAGREIEKHRDK